MFSMMLGPLGQSYWLGSSAMPKASIHHDWSRVAFQAASTTNSLDAFSYGIGTQQPAALTAAIGGTAANENDTSISKADALSRDCIATHLGVKVDNVALATAVDVILTLAAVRAAISRILVRVFYAERSNEEFVGKVEDLPEGKGFMLDWADNAVAFGAAHNGYPSLHNIRPLPQPLPCEGGKTYFRVTFEPSRRGNGVGNGVAFGTVTSLRADVYGIAPPRALPVEAMQSALAALRAHG
jgi:hypothetical protein